MRQLANRLWMRLAATVSVTVVLAWLVPAAQAQVDDLPKPPPPKVEQPKPKVELPKRLLLPGNPLLPGIKLDGPAMPGLKIDLLSKLLDQNANPDEILRDLEADLAKMLKEMGVDNPGLGGGFGGFGGLGGINLPDEFGPIIFGSRPGVNNTSNVRLGVRVERPAPALVEQLDLPADKGLVLAEIVAGSPAEKAGLKKNDILLELAGRPVPNDPREFAELVRGLKAKAPLEAKVLRKGKQLVVAGLTLPEQKAEANVRPRPFVFPELKLPGVDGGGFINRKSSISVRLNNQDFDVTAKLDGVEANVTGTLVDGKIDSTKIRVRDGETVIDAPSIEQVPDRYRPLVEDALRAIPRIRTAPRD